MIKEMTSMLQEERIRHQRECAELQSHHAVEIEVRISKSGCKLVNVRLHGFTRVFEHERGKERESMCMCVRMYVCVFVFVFVLVLVLVLVCV